MAGYEISQLDFQERYNKIRDIHSTGMSRVWLVKDAKYDRKVVMKLLAPAKKISRSDYDEFRARFEQEARIACQLNHPNMIQVYDFGVCNRVHFIVAEYVDGVDLENGLARAREKGYFALDDFLAIFYQVCDAVEWAHKKGVIHRDIKPRNVLLGKTGKLVVCDFGISKILGVDVEEDEGSTSKVKIPNQVMTAKDVILGTPSYLSPEQVRAHPVDKRTDVYQLGAILYQGITGSPPFAQSMQEIRRRQRLDDHSFPRPNSDKRLESIVLRSMQAEKEDRQQSVSELKQEVKEYLNSLEEGERKGWFGKKHRERVFLVDIVKKWVKG